MKTIVGSQVFGVADIERVLLALASAGAAGHRPEYIKALNDVAIAFGAGPIQLWRIVGGSIVIEVTNHITLFEEAP